MIKTKTFLITGAANGIGKHLALRAISEGYKVIATDISSEMLKQNFASSGNVMTIQLDVSKWASWENLLGEIISNDLSIDVLMNVAGIIEPGFIYDTSIDQIDRQIDINLKGTIYGCKCFAAEMKKNKSGHIINFSSMAGIAPVSGINVYSATKFGVRGFSLATAQELKSFDVAVSVVCPDATKTAMLDYQKDFDAAAMTFSAPKYLTVEEIGDVVFDEVLKKKMPEIWIPKSRGALALLGSTFPKLAGILTEQMTKIGKKKQQNYS